jgi:hypothetical protein
MGTTIGDHQAGGGVDDQVFPQLDQVRYSHLGLTYGNGVWLEVCPQVKRAVSTVLCTVLQCLRGPGPSLLAGLGVGDGEGEFFEFGDQGAEAAVVVEPLPVVVELVVGDEPGDGFPGGLAGPLPVGAVQVRGVGVAAAGGLAAADVPLEEGAGQGRAEAGELGGDAGGAGLPGRVRRHVLMVARGVPRFRLVFQY